MTSRHHLFFIPLLGVVILDVVTTTANLASGTMMEGGLFMSGIVESVPVHLVIKIAFAVFILGLAVFAKRRFGTGWSERVQNISIEAAIFVPCTALLSLAVINNLYWLVVV